MPSSSGCGLIALSVFQPMCGIFRAGSAGAILSTSPAIQPRPFGDLVLEPALGHQLHADADAEERTAALAHAFVERLDHAVDGVETAPAIGKGADAGKHDAVGARDRLGAAGDHDRLRVAGFARRALERLGGRMQIARPVVDDRNGHRCAPGCGNRPMTSGAGDAPRCAGGRRSRARHRRRDAARAFRPAPTNRRTAARPYRGRRRRSCRRSASAAGRA